MMAANYRHIRGFENRLGRHYSRFPAFSPAATLARQSLVLPKSPSGGSNRRSQVNNGSSFQEIPALRAKLVEACDRKLAECARLFRPTPAALISSIACAAAAG